MGAVAGYFGGLVDGVIMRFVDVLLSFPGLLLALGIVALLGPGINNVILAVGISGVTGYARLVRGCVLSGARNPTSRRRTPPGVAPAGSCCGTCCPTSSAR